MNIKRAGRRKIFFTHGGVAIVAAAAGYFFMFYGYPYVFPPSLRHGPHCSPVTVTFINADESGNKLKIEQSSCVSGWENIAVSLQNGNGTVSQPFFVGDGEGAVLRASWTSPGSASLYLTGKDIDVEYALDRVNGIKMDYAMHETPAQGH